MSDDGRREDDYSEYGSLFDDSPGTGVMPVTDGTNTDVGFDDGGDDLDGEGFGDLTWADDAPAAADPTDIDNYQPPTDERSGRHSGAVAQQPGRSTGRFDAVGGADGNEWAGAPAAAGGEGAGEDVDVWSSFNSESPVWDEDGSPIAPADRPAAQPAASDAPPRRVVIDDSAAMASDRAVSGDPAPAAIPDRIQIGTDPAHSPHGVGDQRESRSRGQRDRGRTADPRRGRRGAEPSPRSRTPQGGGAGGRDLPMAIAVGLLLAVLFVAVLSVDALRYWGVIAMVTLVMGVAAVEFFGRVTDKGYRPAMVPGVLACIASPLVAYWVGDVGLPLVMTFGFIVVSVSFIAAHSVDAAPMPNIAITNMGIIWIGLLGSFAMLILRFSTANAANVPSSDHYGTDTLFLLALGVVVNDIGALVVGSFVGRTPLRAWISPNKTVEGLMGGTAFTIIALIVYGQVSRTTTWVSARDLLILALVISVTAPLGDLVESMFKRNMDIKDFGTIVKGHGGVLDRFDGFLFTLPAVYYVTEVLQPWAHVG